MEEHDNYVSLSQQPYYNDDPKNRNVQAPNSDDDHSDSDLKEEPELPENGINIKWRAFSLLRRQFLRIQRIKAMEREEENGNCEEHQLRYFPLQRYSSFFGRRPPFYLQRLTARYHYNRKWRRHLRIRDYRMRHRHKFTAAINAQRDEEYAKERAERAEEAKLERADRAIEDS